MVNFLSFDTIKLKKTFKFNKIFNVHKFLRPKASKF